ncbi:MAG TPA: ROK family protein [Bryobacteraceae bacterium]|jgi:predicted NBD/HSP70 family sugar kinase|nr:ROK family protein [Bryobacteraceae bacterium]
MALGIGILITEKLACAVVEDHAVVDGLRVEPEDQSIKDSLQGVPAEQIIERIVDQVGRLNPTESPAYIGVGMPGIVRNGFVQDSPNLVQFKGFNMQGAIAEAFRPRFGNQLQVGVFNDGDVMAAGIAAKRGHLDRLIRVWTLGTGIGYGRYPFQDGVWEAGHSVVTLDPKEHYCGCGGVGHLEGIMGYRAMRLRFMDLEPEEVFEQAKQGEARCVEFVKLWHRALAAATATSIHLDGPGKFFITGPNARYINLGLLTDPLHDMVKLSPLQSYAVEVVSGGESVAIVGAAVNAAQLAGLG